MPKVTVQPRTLHLLQNPYKHVNLAKTESAPRRRRFGMDSTFSTVQSSLNTFASSALNRWQIGGKPPAPKPSNDLKVLILCGLNNRLFLYAASVQSKTPLQATGYQTCSAAEQRGIWPSRQSPNVQSNLWLDLSMPLGSLLAGIKMRLPVTYSLSLGFFMMLRLRLKPVIWLLHPDASAIEKIRIVLLDEPWPTLAWFVICSLLWHLLLVAILP